MKPISTAARNSRWVVGVLVIFTLFGAGFGSWLARLPAVRDHLGASTFEMSVIGLVLATGSLLGLIFAGRTVSWLGPKRALLWSALGQSAMMPLGAVLLWVGLPVPGVLMLAAYGLCFSTGDVAMNVSGANAERAVGKPRMPILHAGYSFGGVAAMGIGALAEVLQIPVPIHLTVVFALIAACALVALRVVPSVELPEPKVLPAPTASESVWSAPAQPQPLNTNTGPLQYIDPATVVPGAAAAAAPSRYNPWRDPRILVIGFITLALSLNEGTATDWLPLALTDHREFTNSAAALALGLFFVSMMVTRIFGGPLIERLGRVLILRCSAVLVSSAIVIVNVVPDTWGGYACALLWGVGGALGFPIGISAAADNPERAVRAVATVSAIAYSAFLLGPMAIGFLGEQFGLLTAFWPLIAFLVFVLFAAPAAREQQANGKAAGAAAPHATP